MIAIPKGWFPTLVVQFPTLLVSPPPSPVVNTTVAARNSTPKNVRTPVTVSLAPTMTSDAMASRTNRLGVLQGGGGRCHVLLSCHTVNCAHVYTSRVWGERFWYQGSVTGSGCPSEGVGLRIHI